MKTLITLVALLAAALLVACKPDVPAFDSASVEVYVSGHLTAVGVLGDSQIEAVKKWLEARKTGWEHRLESTAPALLVKLAHRGKVVAVMNILSHEVKVGDFFRRITSEERDMLHLLLTTFLSSKKEASTGPSQLP